MIVHNFIILQDDTADKSYWDTVQETNAEVADINESCRLDGWAVSAVSRAKSDSCKDQIVDVACRLYNNSLIPKKLPRFCQREGESSSMERTAIFTIFLLSWGFSYQSTLFQLCRDVFLG